MFAGLCCIVFSALTVLGEIPLPYKTGAVVASVTMLAGVFMLLKPLVDRVSGTPMSYTDMSIIKVKTLLERNLK